MTTHLYEVAKFGKRSLAATIDLLLALGSLSLLLFLSGHLFIGLVALGQAGTPDTLMWSVILVTPAILLGVSAPLFYFLICVYMTAHVGITPGKWVLGLRISTTQGFSPSLKTSFLRYFLILLLWILFWVPVIGPFLTIGGFFTVLLDKEKKMRSWHDLAARTIVIDYKKPSNTLV